MNEKENNNIFRFSLYQENILLCEKQFNADQYNPFTRYSIDIRTVLPKIITILQKVMSKKSYNVFAEVGRLDVTKDYEDVKYDLYGYVKERTDYNPQPVVQHIDEKTIRGVECKIGFYINDNPIVERLFYVDGFNPVARWSVDLTEAVLDVVDLIFNQIKKADVKNMWDDYDLINVRGFSINQIREFSQIKREELLKKVRRN